MSMYEYGEAEFGETGYGEAEYGEAAFGEAEYGEAGYGEAEFGEAEYGEAAFGEAEYGESEQFLGDVVGSLFGETSESPLGEAYEVELATELLEISNEQELEQFLGNLFKRASRAIGGFIRSPVGRALGGALKGVVKKALPMVGGALGSFVAPGVGTAIGSRLGSMASGLFEMELGELSGEQAEFEVARRIVNLATTAAQQAALAPPTASPRAVAQTALATAAQAHAPGLARMIAASTGARLPHLPQPRPSGYGRPPGVPCPPGAAATGIPSGVRPGPVRPGVDGHRGGRWFRRGNKIIIVGA